MNSRSLRISEILILLGLLTTVASSQVPFRIGITSGLNFANAHLSASDPDVTFLTRTAPMFGGMIDAQLSDLLFIRGELRYTPKGSRADVNFFGQKLRATWKFDYFEMPVAIGLNVQTTPFKLFIFSGPNLGLRVSAKGESESDGQTFSMDMIDVTKLVDFAIDFGMGGEFTLGLPNVFFAEVRYSYGLTDVSSPQDSQGHVSWKSRDVKFQLGAFFDL